MSTRGFKRLLGTSGAAGMLAALAFAPSAQAQVGVGFSCVVQGVAYTDPAVDVTGGTGTYHFDSSRGLGMICLTSLGPSTVWFVSDGNYTNQVCGTGFARNADGQNFVTATGAFGLFLLTRTHDDWNYNIAFAALHGTLLFKDSPQNTVTGDTGDANNATNAKGGGLIEILDPSPAGQTTPLGAPPPVPPNQLDSGINPKTGNPICTSDFQVDGAVSGYFPP